MARPELVILDEPTSGIDPLVQAEVLDLIEEARDEGRSVFLSSHILSDVQRVADHVIVLRAGRVVAGGAVDDLRRSARQSFEVWFAAEVPVTDLRATPGVELLSVRGSQATGVVAGDPNPLLATLARHRVNHLVLPEPDLEQAFLRLFESGER